MRLLTWRSVLTREGVDPAADAAGAANSTAGEIASKPKIAAPKQREKARSFRPAVRRRCNARVRRAAALA
jgi:hypothetical protein